jgi:hypothetical protein
METVNKECDIQEFICDHPWLLNLNYQNVPELKEIDKEMELHIEGNKRTDLILKDNLGYPVLVEFKKEALTRATIGQILEYKARIITSLNKEDKILYNIFGNKILSPKMVIVVKESDDYGKIACHLQNIDLFEYGNIESKIFTDIGFRKSADAFSETLKKLTPHLNLERYLFLENNVISVIKDIFKENGIEHELCSYKSYDSYAFGDCWDYKSLFLNKFILQYKEIDIGIYEDIFQKENMPVCISYSSMLKDKDKLEKLKELIEKDENKDYFDHEIIPPSYLDYYMLNFWYKSEKFYENPRKILEFNIKKYLELCPLK